MSLQTPDQWKDRELRFEESMSDFEALMWNIEKDPWLNPSGGAVVIVDRPIDMVAFRRRIRWAVAQVPRLRERVVAETGRLGPPVWRVDRELHLDYHLRHLALPAPGDERQLLDLATRLYEDPYDRTRPLWMFVVIDGLADGRSAIFYKLHHSIADGIGAVRLAEMYMELEPDSELPPEVDLDALVAEEVAARREAREGPTQGATDLARAALSAMSKPVDLARRAAGELALWPADPQRPVEGAEDLVETARAALAELQGDEGDEPGGSTLWRNRSRRRHLEIMQVDMARARTAAKALGGSLNDFFVTGVVEGAARYHRHRGVPVPAFNLSFVVSTRSDEAVGGNSFAPTRLQAPGGDLPPADLFVALRDKMTDKRASVGAGSGALGPLAAAARVLPTSLLARFARGQAARMDFATSNLRAAPFPVYVSGARLLATFPMGPVAGTAFNITLMSYDGSLDIGLFVDPRAVTDPGDLRDSIARAFDDLIGVGSGSGGGQNTRRGHDGG